jgi:ABC-type glycerol-3-phosphate transport system permease component
MATPTDTSPVARWSGGARIAWYFILGMHSIFVLYPMFWLITTSLKDSWEIFKDPWALPPSLRFIN